ncbi:MAG: hypothetical protein V3W20_08190 [Candidatus Neomarinimicrobiota bacterium]
MTKLCATCGKEFNQYRTTEKYCSWNCSKTKPIKPRSDKRAKQEREYLVVRAEYLEEHPKCEVCKVSDSTEAHHKRGRLGKLLIDKEFFLACCRPCHQNIELHSDWARENGYILNRFNK